MKGHDVGVQRADRRDDLAGLLLQLGRRRRAPAAAAEGEEVVQDVERPDLHVAADRVGGRGTGVLRGEDAVGGAVGGLQAPGVEAVAEHQRRGEGQLVADPHRGGGSGTGGW